MILDRTKIPATITTVEQLHAWSGMLLHRLNTTLKNLESENFSDYVCQVSLFTAADATQRITIRHNLELNPDYTNNGKKVWENVKELSSQAIPSGYTA